MISGRFIWVAVALAAGMLFGSLGLAALALSPSPLSLAAGIATEPQGFELSPGYGVMVDPGDVVQYVHVLTNTGLSMVNFSVVAVASEEWPLQYTNAAYPGGTTLLMPFPLAAGQSVTLGVKLWVPADVARYTVNTTTLTVTSLPGPERIVVYDLATVKPLHVYLPLVLRSYPNSVYLRNGDFSAGLAEWTVLGTLGVFSSVDPSPPYGPVALLGDPRYSCKPDPRIPDPGVPVATGGIRQVFSVPPAPPGRSAYLRFRYRIYSNDRNPNLLDQWDTFDVYVNGVRRFRDANRVWFDYCNVPPYDLGWKTADISLGGGGSSTTFVFEVANRGDNYYNTYVYLDDVHIEFAD